MKKILQAFVIIAFLTVSCEKDAGRMIDVDGHAMYLICEGSGSPTIILEAGYNDVSDTWSLVQPEVAGFTRVCAYDRAGLGRSESGPEPRDSDQVIHELHSLLENAGIEGPYILVGHSLGGMYMRLFADDYPDEVAGLVLVDAAHKDDAERCAAALPPESEDESESLKSLRVYLADPIVFPDIPDHIFEPGSLDDLPLIVLSVPSQQRPGDLPIELRDALDEIWMGEQEEWALISTHTTHILVYDSSHFIQQDQPEQVVDAIRQVFEEVQPDSQ